MKIPCEDCITFPVCINVVKNTHIGGIMSVLSRRCSVFDIYCNWENLPIFRRRKIKTLDFFKIEYNLRDDI